MRIRTGAALRGGPYDGDHAEVKYGIGYFEPEIIFPGRIRSKFTGEPRARYRLSDSGERIKVWLFDEKPWFPVPEIAFGLVIYDYIEEKK